MSDILTPKAIGELVRAKRKEAGLTQEITAMMCGVTKKTLIRIEKGEDVYISTLFKLLNGLGIKLVQHKPQGGNTQIWY